MQAVAQALLLLFGFLCLPHLPHVYHTFLTTACLASLPPLNKCNDNTAELVCFSALVDSLRLIFWTQVEASLGLHPPTTSSLTRQHDFGRAGATVETRVLKPLKDASGVKDEQNVEFLHI